MALTKITGQVVDTTTDLVVGVTTVGGGVSAVDGFFSGIVTFSQGVSIGGTLTYEDVTNIDSVGLITARSGIEIGASPGVAASISVDGNMIVSGISTFGGDIKTSASNIVLGDSGGASDDRLTFGAGTDLSIYHDGSNSYISNGTNNLIIKDTTGDDTKGVYIQSSLISFQDETTNEQIAKFIGDGAVELYYDNSKKIETTSTGTKIIGDLFLDNPDHAGKDIEFDSSLKTLKFDDGVAAKFGTGSDLSIYHDGNNSIITAGNAGDLQLISTFDDIEIKAADNIFIRPQGGEEGIKVMGDGAVELYYDGSKKLETSDTGVSIGTNDDSLAQLSLIYSTVPAYLTNSFDGTVGEATLSVNVPRTSAGSGSWGSHSNTGYGSAAIQALSHSSSGGYVSILTGSADNTNPTEKMRVTHDGYSKHSNDGTYDLYANAINAHQFRQSQSSPTLWCSNTNTSSTWDIIRSESARTGNSAFHFFVCTSGNLSDDEFRVRGDGQVYADGSFNSGGADYAEYFEWTDGNSSNEDRRGMTVVLDGNKVKLSTSSDSTDNIIGVVSGNASVIGDAASEKWTDKYLRDDYGTYLKDENGDRKLNPSFDDTKTYVSREDRQEWDAIGMVGKLRIRKGQTTGTRWIKMRDISDTVEEWLVR